MPKRREFGISDYLLALVIALLVGCVILSKWKWDRIAKRAEIRKLLRLAEEEASRVKSEAVVEYTYSAAVVTLQCAVCFSPTTTRCSRCKAVKYWTCGRIFRHHILPGSLAILYWCCYQRGSPP